MWLMAVICWPVITHAGEGVLTDTTFWAGNFEGMSKNFHTAIWLLVIYPKGIFGKIYKYIIFKDIYCNII